MNQSLRTHCRRQPLAALAAVLVLALVSTPIQAAGPGLTGYVYALDAKGKITGTVPGAALEFTGAEAVQATADKNGLYKVDLRAGTYTYKLTAAGFKAENVGRAVTTAGGDGYQVKNFGLSPGKTDLPKTDPTQKPHDNPAPAAGILQGEVVEKTADGKEVPIPGATVYLRNKAGKSPLSQVMTRFHEDKARPGQRQGHYELELPAGTYAASVVAGGFDRFKQAEPVTIVAGSTATQRFVLTRAAPPAPEGQGIEGTVHFADPGKAAAALPPITVSLVPVGHADRPAATFTPDPTGGFQRNLLAGRYRLQFQAKGYRTYPRPIPDVYVLGGGYTKVNVYLVPDLLFGAMVYERVGRRAKLLSGASVALTNSGEPAGKAVQLTTDKNGYASVPRAKAGNYVAVARLAGYADAKGVNVKVSATGANRAIIELVRETTPPPAHLYDLTIVAKTESKEPLHGADVHVTPQGEKPGSGAVPVPPGTTDLSGSYTAKGLSAGSYTVQVSMKGYKAASPPPTVVLTKNDSQEIILTADTPATPSTFDLVVMARSGGQPVTDAECTVKRAGKTVVSGMSDDSGSYTAAGLDAGFYVVQVTKDGFTGNKSVTLYKNDRVEIALTATSPPTPPPPVELPIELVTVPNVTGSMEPVVRSTLTAVGLKEEFTGNPNLGPARFQNYRAGAKVKPGTTVAVYFPEPPPPPPPGPTLPPPPELVTVPNVTGVSELVVKSTLAAVGLKEEFTGNPNLGPVKWQNYHPGSKVKPGTTIVVTFPESPPPPALITVPNVTGLNLPDVQSKLAAVGLKFAATGDSKLGPSTFQNYRAGAHVKPDTVVAVTFPETPPPPALITVPNVTGLNLPDVQSKLAAVGLKFAATGDSKLGPSTFQNYRAGAHVKPDTVVAVTFPETPPPPALITVPNVTGATGPVVRSTLTAAGLQADFTGDPNQGPSTFQNYHAGAHVKPGTVVVVYFPETPPPPALVIVPNVTGLNQPDVQRALAAVGLQEQFTGNPSLGPARSQNYRAGAHVNPGTVVAVYFPEAQERPNPPPPPVNTLVTVPNLVGSTGPVVRAALAAVGLNADFTGNPNLGPATFQNYRAGAQVPPGTTISVYFPETANPQYPTPTPAPTPPASKDLFAAIAYSPATGQAGHGYNYASRWAAEAEAVRMCNAADARVVVWVKNGFCALALGDDKSYWGDGFSYGDKDTASNRAVAECGQRTTNAHFVRGVYSNNTPPEIYR